MTQGLSTMEPAEVDMVTDMVTLIPKVFNPRKGKGSLLNMELFRKTLGV